MASQLHELGLCPASHLTALAHYVANRQEWFDAITEFHGIPETTSTGGARGQTP